MPQHHHRQTADHRARQAHLRAKQRARRQRMYRGLDAMFHLYPDDLWLTIQLLAKWIIFGGGVGILAGTASAIFLTTLGWATNFRLANLWLLLLLPVAGTFIGWIYFRFAGSAARGNNLIIDEIHLNKEPIPVKMAPLVLLGTVVTHLFGGSAGREGTALQMGASLADWFYRRLKLSQTDRRMMLMAGVSGGFGSVFGTPIAGFVFGLEVQSIGHIGYEGMIPALVAALVGDLATRAWGVAHSHYPTLINIEIEPLLLSKVVVAGILFGLTSLLFVELTHGIKHLMKDLFGWSPLRPLVGGFAIIGLTLLVGTQDYSGLSLPLIQNSVTGKEVATFAFLGKLVFTAVTLGTGFLGGEVTPLFVIGATLGATLGRLLGVEPGVMASLGFVAVFAGASNTPLACALMGVELFGGGSVLYIGVACFVAYLASGHRSIYSTQRIGTPKVPGTDTRSGESLESMNARRPGWLPPLLISDPMRRPLRATMSPAPVSAHEDTPIDVIIDRVIREGVRTLPVVDKNGEVVGIITDNDLLRRGGLAIRLGLLTALTPEERSLLTRDALQRCARDVMTAPVITIRSDTALKEAITQFRAHDLKRLPVVNEHQRLVGMVTRSDVLRELTFSETPLTWAMEMEPTSLGWNAPVERVMVTDVPTVAPTASLDHLIQKMLNAVQQRVVVLDAEQKVIGLVTDGDLLQQVPVAVRPGLLHWLTALWTGDASQTPATPLSQSSLTAADVMTTPIHTIQAGTSLHKALEVLMQHQIKRLPVVDGEGHLLGLVGRAGLIEALMTKPPLPDSNRNG